MIIKYKIGNAERKTTGTFTERDYVRKVAEDQHPSHWPVCQLPSPNVVCFSRHYHSRLHKADD